MQGNSIDPYFVESKDTGSIYGPDHIVRDLLQDRNGIYWFATWHGIVSYDGKLFTNHTLKEDLIRFHIVSVFEDSKGAIWFGTARGGLYKYDGKVFTLFTMNEGLVDNTVMCMAEDRNGDLWFGTEKGVSKFFDGSFINFTVQEGLSDNYVSSILCDRNGKLWFGTNNGISCYDGKIFSAFKPDNSLVIKKVMELFEDKTGNIWIGTFDGLWKFDGKSMVSFLSPHLTYYMTMDKDGSLFFTHSEPNTEDHNIPNQVLYKYDGSSFVKVIEKNTQNDFQIFGKAIDRNGNLWFGTMHGPCKYDGRRFTYYYAK